MVADAMDGTTVRIEEFAVVSEKVVITPVCGFLLVHGCE
jgi:hypothetical protein